MFIMINLVLIFLQRIESHKRQIVRQTLRHGDIKSKTFEERRSLNDYQPHKLPSSSHTHLASHKTTNNKQQQQP